MTLIGVSHHYFGLDVNWKNKYFLLSPFIDHVSLLMSVDLFFLS
jgi:hypothetical protein